MNLLSDYVSTQPVTQARQRSLSHPVWQRGRQERADSIRRNAQPKLVLPFPNLTSETPSSSLNSPAPVVSRPPPLGHCLASPGFPPGVKRTEANTGQGGPFPRLTLVLLDCPGPAAGRRQLRDRRASTYKEYALQETATAAKMGKNPV